MEAVDPGDDPKRDEERFVVRGIPKPGNQVTYPKEDDPETKLRGDVGVEVALREFNPKYREKRTHQYDKEKVEELGLPRRHLEEAEHVAVHVSIGKQGERRSGLLKQCQKTMLKRQRMMKMIIRSFSIFPPAMPLLINVYPTYAKVRSSKIPTTLL